MVERVGRHVSVTEETGVRKPTREKSKKKNKKIEKAELSQFPFLLLFLKGIPLQRMTFQKPAIIDDMTNSNVVIGGICLYSATKNNA